MALTDKQARSAKPSDKPYKLVDTRPVSSGKTQRFSYLVFQISF